MSPLWSHVLVWTVLGTVGIALRAFLRSVERRTTRSCMGPCCNPWNDEAPLGLDSSRGSSLNSLRS